MDTDMKVILRQNNRERADMLIANDNLNKRVGNNDKLVDDLESSIHNIS